MLVIITAIPFAVLFFFQGGSVTAGVVVGYAVMPMRGRWWSRWYPVTMMMIMIMIVAAAALLQPNFKSQPGD